MSGSLTDDVLFEKTKVAAYFLWEYTRHGNALNLWYCAEDIACFFEQAGIGSVASVREIMKKGAYDAEYIQFVRQIAYRVYDYTDAPKPYYNWLVAERLILNGEWCAAIVGVADAYRAYKRGGGDVCVIRSEKIRNYYKSFRQE